MHELEAEDFLELIWGEENEGWVELPAKVNGYWVPYHMEWPPSSDLIISRRIDQSLFDQEDLYFSVARFSQRGRSISDVLPIAWLWADLDAVHPSAATAMGLMPTIAVESSPGRYQAYWQLDHELRPAVVEKLNRALTYALGADKGGWDLTQVLRVPGTRNFKYKGSPRVRMLYHREGLVYKPRYVWAKVREQVSPEELKGVTSAVLPRKDIPRKAKQLLWTKREQVVEGERSARLWELNCLLAESGLTDAEIFGLVVHCVWNKWAGQRSMKARLMGDIRKAITHVRRKAANERGRKRADEDVDAPVAGAGAQRGGRDLRADRAAGVGDDRVVGDGGGSDDSAEDGGRDRLPFISYSTFMAMAMEEPKWLIEDIWTAGSHGILGGEPKTSKTTLALALALAVASGRDFLGRYPVGVTGPVLFVQEENAPWMMQDRLRKLAAHSGLISMEDAQVRRASVGGLSKTVVSVDMPADVPLWILNNYGFDLSVEEHRDMLEGYVEEIRPALVILDPLYMMFGPVDANNMGQLQPFLRWITMLRFKYGCAVMIVHHMGKQHQATVGRRAGQRLIGSATLHGFTDAALYTTKVDDARSGWTRVCIEREFRAIPDSEPINMAWSFGEGLDVSIDLDPPLTTGSSSNGRVWDNDLLGGRKQTTIARLAKERGASTAKIKRLIEADDLLGIKSTGPGKSPIVYRVDRNGN